MSHPVRIAMLLVLSFTIAGSATAYETSETIRYQGVLRSATGVPLSGEYDMVFRYWSQSTGGEEIMVELRNDLDSSAVTVENGLFSVELGAGFTTDGSGPGSYDLLPFVFEDYLSVFLEIQVGSEVLSPRIAMNAAPYAINALAIGGVGYEDVLNRTDEPQTKSGPLAADSSGTPGSFGVTGIGPSAGGYIRESVGSGVALVGSGGYGIQGFGSSGGAYFEQTGTGAYAQVANQNYGIRGYGDTGGGFFRDDNDSGYSFAGYFDWGIASYGNTAGGYFQDLDDTGWANVGSGDYGIHARGAYQTYLNGGGGRFEDTVYTGMMIAAHGNRGVYGEGSFAGGEFVDSDSSGYGRVGYDAYKIIGSGTVSFVQNHPDEADKVVVYHAPEASEVAVYTRGSGRLSAGFAQVDLDKTFGWVTNPDLGLTAHLTPRGISCALHVAEITTGVLTVGSSDPRCAEVAFDYMVYGLRIGFEEMAPVQEKDREAMVPSMASQRSRYAADESLREFNALQRFEDMESRLHGESRQGIDRSSSANLLVRIGEFDPTTQGTPGEVVSRTAREPRLPSAPESSGAMENLHSSAEITESIPASTADARVDTDVWVPVAEPVTAGEVLVFDPQRPGSFRRPSTIGDRNVIGVTVSDSRLTPEGTHEAPLAEGRYATIQVDTGFGAIRPGDLLVASPTRGMAMLAIEPAQGSVFARALEECEAGFGRVRVQLLDR